MKINKTKLELGMAKACLTPQELAEQAGVSIQTLDKIKGGKVSSRPHTAGRIARALGVDVTELLEEA